MNGDKLQGIRQAVLVVMPLSVLVSCSASSADQGNTLLLDLNSYSPLIAYTVAGNVMEVKPEPESFCTTFGSIRDLTSKYLLHSEGLHTFVHPDLQTIKTAVRDLSGKIRATFPVIPKVNDIRLAPSGNEVVFSGCSPRDL